MDETTKSEQDLTGLCLHRMPNGDRCAQLPEHAGPHGGHWSQRTETTMRCPAEMNGERCHYLSWHTGDHRSEHHDWPREVSKYCAADTEHGACLRRPGHTGEHAWRTVTAEALDRGERWRPSEEGMRAAAGLRSELRPPQDVHLPQPGEEWPPVPCGAPIEGLSGEYTVCNVIAGHIGTHQHLPVDLNSDAGEDGPELPVRERRPVTVSALTRLRRELREELLGKLDRLEKAVSLRLDALEERIDGQEVRPVRGLTEVELRMTALEGRVIEWLNGPEPDKVTEPSVRVYGIDVTEWDRRIDRLDARLESGFHLVMTRLEREKADAEISVAEGGARLVYRGDVYCRVRADVCANVGEWTARDGCSPVAVVCTRIKGHTGRCNDQGMTWDALCADSLDGDPWCRQRPGHGGPCDPEPDAQPVFPQIRHIDLNRIIDAGGHVQD